MFVMPIRYANSLCQLMCNYWSATILGRPFEYCHLKYCHLKYDYLSAATINATAKLRKISVPSEVEVDSARNINISQRIKKLLKIFTQKI